MVIEPVQNYKKSTTGEIIEVIVNTPYSKQHFNLIIQLYD